MEKIAACKPLNITASLVTQQGNHFEPKKHINPTVKIFDDCPTLTVYRKWPSCIPKLAGIRVGRFTVKGLALDYPKRWVVKCDCGKYQLMTAKAIRNPDNIHTMCMYCESIQTTIAELDHKHLHEHKSPQWSPEKKAANRLRMENKA